MATTRPLPTVVFFIIVCSTAAIAGAQRDAPPPPPETNPYARFNPSIAIIVVILLSAFFLMAFFALYIRRCADDDPSTARAGGPRSRRAASATASRGLDPAIVAAFPTLEYSVVKDLKLGKSALECAVCLCEFDDDELLRLLPACSHVFHPDCIGEWLRSHTTCPVCRANLAAPGHAPAPPDPIPAAGSDSDSDSVAIDIDADPIPVAAEVPERPPAVQRAKSMRRARFPRSHSTGHSVVRPGEDCERYTLRLPEEVRKEVLRGKLNRTGSSVGGRGRSFGRWERFARSDRWVPFFSRSFTGLASSRSIRRGREEPGSSGGGGDGGSVGRSGRKMLTSVKAPFECLTGARAGADPVESSSRSADPVFTVTSSG